MCDLMINNISEDPFLSECSIELSGKFRGIKEVNDPLMMASEIYDKNPPKVALLDCDDSEIKTIFGFVSPHVGYLVGFTKNYDDKDFVKSLYMCGFSDVRPKRNAKSVVIAIRPVVKRRETMRQRKVCLS